jgi:hypothetical protein
MGEVIPFPSHRRDAAAGGAASRPRPPQTVFENRGWRILALPHVGRFVAVSDYCRRGVEIGRFDPQAEPFNHYGGSAVAILTRCGSDERLSRCAIAWLNSALGPRAVILGPFVVAAGGRFHFWRDAIVETAVIGGTKLVRLIDGSVAIAREPEPVPLIDPFAPLPHHRRRPAFDRLPAEMRAAVLRWTDPLGQFGKLLGPVWSS